MSNDRDLEKELKELKAEVSRLTESVERKAWGNPHDFAYRALASVELIRDYYGSGGQGAEMLRELVEGLRTTAAHREGYQHAGAAFIYGVADLIEGAYLENRYNQQVHAHAQKLKREGK